MHVSRAICASHIWPEINDLHNFRLSVSSLLPLTWRETALANYVATSQPPIYILLNRTTKRHMHCDLVLRNKKNDEKVISMQLTPVSSMPHRTMLPPVVIYRTFQAKTCFCVATSGTSFRLARKQEIDNDDNNKTPVEVIRTFLIFPLRFMLFSLWSVIPWLITSTHFFPRSQL